MNLSAKTEIEAAALLRDILPDGVSISFGRGRTHEGGNAPDLVIHTSRDVSDGFIKHSTIGVHALLTKSYTYKDYWKFSLLDETRVHHNVASYAPAIQSGVDMAARKRPAGTVKDIDSVNFGKAVIDHAIYFKPQTETSINHVVFFNGEYTPIGCAIATSIVDHVESYGPFVIDVKGGSLSQLSNVSFNASRISDKYPIRFDIDTGSLPNDTKMKLIQYMNDNLQEKVHKYLDDISAIVGRPIHTTKFRKYKNKIGDVYISPRDDLDLPEEALKHVSFYHLLGTDKEAALGLKLSFNKIATGYKLEEYKCH